MATTVSITNNGNGKYTIKDSDGQTRVVNQAQATAEAAKAKIQISNQLPGVSSSGTGYSLNTGSSFPGSNQNSSSGTVDLTVLIADPKTGKMISAPVADAVALAYDAKRLGVIRSNLLKYGQLTKAEARDPNNLLNKWAQIVYGAANDSNPKNRDPFVYAQELQKQGFGSTAGATGYTGPMVYPRITSTEDAKAKIVDSFKTLLNREPTADEIAKATKALNADENNPKNYQTQTPIKNAAGQITGYKTTGGTNIEQFLTDYVNSKFAKEAEAVKVQAPEVTTLAKDKATYDKLIAEAGGDLEKINAAKQNTTYGRTLSEITAQITDMARKAGAQNDPASVANIAKYVVDRGLNINSESAQSYIESQLNFGKGKVTTGDKTTEMYTGKAGSNVDALNKVALANGLTLDKVFDAATLNDVLSAVNAGEDISTYTKIIRDAAKVAWNVSDNVAKLMDQGVSLDAIYGTYKNAYADTLELDPNSITLNDLAKVGVIGQQGANSTAPQNLYDFTKSLRKDDRWQYTQQAHNEVADATQKILRDFGFMG